MVRTDYPLLLDEEACPRPLAGVLAQVAESLPADEAQIVADNLGRLERVLLQTLPGSAPTLAQPVLSAAGAQLMEQLGLPDGPAKAMQSGVDTLVAAIPAHASLLTYSPDAALWLIARAAAEACATSRVSLARERSSLRDKLAALVALEEGRDPKMAQQQLAAAVGTLGGERLDSDRLAQVLGPPRGGEALGDEQLQRARTALDTLGTALDAAHPTLVLFHDGCVGDSWECDGVRVEKTPSPYQAARTCFREAADQALGCSVASRTARLLLDRAYNPARHDELARAMCWQDMGETDLLSLPRVVVLDTAVGAADRAGELLGLLSSGLPVHVCLERWPVAAIGDGGSIARLPDLAALVLGSGDTFVLQSSPARPEHFYKGLERAFSQMGSGLLSVCSGYLPDGQAPAVGAWLGASAAIESRAHPLLVHDPDGGGSWAVRLVASENPDLEAVWAGEPCFTFADFALLDPQLEGQFQSLAQEDLETTLPIADWIAQLPESLDKRPTVLASQGGLEQPLVVSDVLTAETLRRGRAWRSLAEMAGHGNAHAAQAAKAAREVAAAENAEVIAKLEQAHAQALEEARNGSTDEVMGRLAQSLLSDGFFSAPTPAPTLAAPAAETGTSPTQEETVTEPVEEEEVGEEPFIDTALCTSCNDCMKVNQLLFVYDPNKQALLGDLEGAYSFKDLVLAAEMCPARCIHPGSPRDPNEQGLDELIERAAPFLA